MNKCRGNFKKVGLLLIYHHGTGKSTLGRFTIGVNIVVGPDLLVAVLFNVGFTWATVLAASNDCANSNEFPYLEPGHI